MNLGSVQPFGFGKRVRGFVNHHQKTLGHRGRWFWLRKPLKLFRYGNLRNGIKPVARIFRVTDLLPVVRFSHGAVVGRMRSSRLPSVGDAT